MIGLRKKHNTENSKTHSGNEKKKRQNFLLSDSKTPQPTSTKKLEPSKCSKLVALILKENSTQQASIV
jgi:hypothetical protein